MNPSMTLRETLERIRALRESVAGLSGSEEAAKIKIILPVLRALGWDTEGSDVDYEYPVGISGDKPDIALLFRNQPVAFVEAKKSGLNLGTPSQVDQVRRYFTSSDAKLCALTNGMDWWLYLARGAEGDDEFKFAELSLLEDPLDELEDDLNMFLGRSKLTKRRGEAATRQALKVLRARIGHGLQPAKLKRIWNDMIDSASAGCLDDELVLLFRKEVYRKFALRPTPEQFAALLRERGSDNGSDHPPPAAPTPPRAPSRAPRDPVPSAAALPPPQGPVPSAPAPPPPPLDHAPEAPAGPHGLLAEGELLVPSSAPLSGRGRNPIAFTLWGERYPIGPYYEIAIGVAEAIYRHHPDNFHRVEQLGGRVISRDPTAFRAQEVAESGWFVDTSHKGKRHIKDARRVLHCCGHNPDDLKLIYGGSDS